jgi:iduronate 2-sulfatase
MYRSIFLFFLIVLFSQACSPPEKKNVRPNILFIAIDDLRPELGCYGQEHISSPHIDQLAEQSLLFNRAYCQQSVCNPSRASIMSGLYPHQSGITDNQKNMREENPEIVTLSQHFKNNGYYAYGVGKIYHYPHQYDSLSWSVPQPYLEGNWWNSYVTEPNLTYKTSTINEAHDTTDLAYFDGRTAQMAIEKLAQLQDSAFFLAVGFFKPHLPFVAPARYWQSEPSVLPLPVVTEHPENAPEYAFLDSKEKIRKFTDVPDQGIFTDSMVQSYRHGYYSCISFIDAQVGKIMKALDSLNMRENTIVVLWGDHGFKLGDYNEWAKSTNYEIDTRVPLMVSVPGSKSNGQTTGQITELIDLYPTLSELANIPVPDHLPGRSFKQLFESNQVEEDYAISMYPRGDSLMGYTIRSDQYRLVRWQSTQDQAVISFELYDHQKDSLETINLAKIEEYQDILKQLDKQLLETIDLKI